MAGLSNISRKDGYLSKTGSAFGAMQEVKSTGDDLDTPDTIHNLGYFEKYTYKRVKTIATQNDQGGTPRGNSPSVTADLTMKMMQRDDGHLNLTNDMDGRYARVYLELSAEKLGTSANKGQIAVIACVTPKESGTGFDGTDMYPDTAWTGQPNGTGDDLVIDLSDFTGGLGAGVGNATIPAGGYEAIVEFTYA